MANKHEQPPSQVTAVRYTGPIPPASEFEKYEAILPGAADRILKMAERQGAHRQWMEKSLVLFEGSKTIGGQLLGGAIALGGLIAGTMLLMNDKPVVGLATMIGAIGTIVGAFLYVQRTERKE